MAKLSRKLIGIGGAILLAIAFVGQRIWALSRGPLPGEKNCPPLHPGDATSSLPTSLSMGERLLSWIQRGGTVNDASCVDETAVDGVVAIHSEEDIKNVLQFAEENKKHVSMSGVRHSMGGQAFAKGNIVLDMRGFNAVTVNEENMTMIVQSGATWHDIQKKLHPKYAVSAMQSTDIFTVGGSISVNAHGMDHNVGAVENSIVSMRVMLADGTVKTLSRTENPELYNLVVGGYGLFGVILDAELRIVPNTVYISSRDTVEAKDFPAFFSEKIQNDPSVRLMYTHLSPVPGDGFLKEGIVYTYRTYEEGVLKNQEIPPLEEVGSIPLRRFLLNISKHGKVFQSLRWWSEKYLEPKFESCAINRNNALSSGEACLVTRNEPMHDSVLYSKNPITSNTDILHEYFIPRENLTSFIDGLREIMVAHHTNLLNASIRVVNAERGMLTYAPKEAFSVVLYINQPTTEEGNKEMEAVTRELIDLAVANDGRFFLPYQLLYTSEQLKASYPNIEEFFEAKRAYDPNELFTNTWYNTYGKAI